MANVHVFKQNYRSSGLDMSTDLGSEASPPAADCIETPAYCRARYYDLIRAVGHVSSCSSGAVVTLAMYEATDATGGGAQALSTTAAPNCVDTYTSVAGGSLDILEAQVRGEGLSSGYAYVGARLTTNDTDGSEVASIFLVQGRARYKQAVMLN